MLEQFSFDDQVLEHARTCERMEAHHREFGDRRSNNFRVIIKHLEAINQMTKRRWGEVGIDEVVVAAWKPTDEESLTKAISILFTLQTPFAQYVREQLITAISGER